MKTTNLPKGTTTNKKTNWAMPDQAVSIDDFMAELTHFAAQLPSIVKFS